MDMNYVDISKLLVRKIEKKVAKKMIVENHYSHSWTSCRYALGLFYITDNSHILFDENEEKLIGVAIYGYPVGRLAAESISGILKPHQVLELTRLFIFDGYGKNIESYFISQTFKWLKRNDDKIKVLLSYSDPQQNHIGTIYQATNWLYQGDSMRMVDAYSVKIEKEGSWLHSRTVFDRWGTSNIESLKRKIGHTFWIREEPRKHRYIYFLCGKRNKNKLVKTLKHPALPYPKIIEYTENIKEIKIGE
tara:strand:- start:61 stop:804 length:744 start_codon:yes stop_codon:yes gene_type:complete